MSRGNLTEDLPTSLPAQQGRVEIPWLSLWRYRVYEQSFSIIWEKSEGFFFFSWTSGIEDPTRDWTCAAYREGQPLVHQGSPKSEGFKLRNRPVNTHVHHRNYLKNSLPVQWLGLHTFTAVAHVRPMVGELRSPKLSMHAWVRPQSCPTLHRAERYINTMQFKASHLFPTKFTSSIYSTNT